MYSNHLVLGCFKFSETVVRILKGIINDWAIVREKEHYYDCSHNVFNEVDSHAVNNLWWCPRQTHYENYKSDVLIL